jgi:phosphatidylglycerol:prolipoprotein diacylglycerol transferase
MGLTADLVFSLAFWMLLPGIVGARLFHVLEYWGDYRGETLAATLAAIVNVPKGGLVVYGSLIGAGIGFFAFVGKYRLPALALADLIAPSLAIGLALGRIGCFLNGCCFGGPCDLPWAVPFPAGSPPYDSQVMAGQISGIDPRVAAAEPPRLCLASAGVAARPRAPLRGEHLVRVNGRAVRSTGEARRCVDEARRAGATVRIETAAGRQVEIPAWSLPVHPTQIYSAVAALLLGLVLWFYYPFRRRDGVVVALLLSIYPVQRILLEIIRVDEPAVFQTGLSISQNVSLLLIIGVVGLWWHVLRRPEGCALPVPGAVPHESAA